jgi:hypothetical protein
MKQMTAEQYKQYTENPGSSDSLVRKWFDIPDNKYYTVSHFPKQGIVNIERHRDAPLKKISKSDQQK